MSASSISQPAKSEDRLSGKRFIAVYILMTLACVGIGWRLNLLWLSCFLISNFLMTTPAEARRPVDWRYVIGVLLASIGIVLLGVLLNRYLPAKENREIDPHQQQIYAAAFWLMVNAGLYWRWRRQQTKENA